MPESRKTQIALRPLRTAHRQICESLQCLEEDPTQYVAMPVLFQSLATDDTSDGETFFIGTKLSDEAADQLEKEMRHSLDARVNKDHLFHGTELRAHYPANITAWYADAHNIFGFLWYAAYHNLEPARALMCKIVDVTGIPGLAMIMLWLQYQDPESLSRLKYEAAVAQTFFHWLKPGVQVSDQFAMAYYQDKWQVEMPKTRRFAAEYYDKNTKLLNTPYEQEYRRLFAENSPAKRMCQRAT